jgi:arsenical resistance protein ArsH
LSSTRELGLLNSCASLPNVAGELFHVPVAEAFLPAIRSSHPPRILLLYGSLRDRSFGRFLTFEAARLLQAMGAETEIFDPRGLPIPDSDPESHFKVAELRRLARWSEGMVWCSPERHGATTSVLKIQINWIPLSLGVAQTLAWASSFSLLAVLAVPMASE